jgi:hypothetical protein
MSFVDQRPPRWGGAYSETAAASIIVFACVALPGCKSPADRCFAQGFAVQAPADCEATCQNEALDIETRAEGCWTLSFIYESGQPEHKDPAKARASLRKSCNLGHRNACAEAGMPYTPRQNHEPR